MFMYRQSTPSMHFKCIFLASLFVLLKCTDYPTVFIFHTWAISSTCWCAGAHAYATCWFNTIYSISKYPQTNCERQRVQVIIILNPNNEGKKNYHESRVNTNHINACRIEVKCASVCLTTSHSVLWFTLRAQPTQQLIFAMSKCKIVNLMCVCARAPAHSLAYEWFRYNFTLQINNISFRWKQNRK